ncbi:MAG: hypothetical protein ABIQ40_20495 [Bacteroidia bacterium]
MKNVIITGSNGMIGGIILQNCLDRSDVAKVTSIVRRKSGISHPKLVEVVHKIFLIIHPSTDNSKIRTWHFIALALIRGKCLKRSSEKLRLTSLKLLQKH